MCFSCVHTNGSWKLSTLRTRNNHGNVACSDVVSCRWRPMLQSQSCSCTYVSPKSARLGLQICANSSKYAGHSNHFSSVAANTGGSFAAVKSALQRQNCLLFLYQRMSAAKKKKSRFEIWILHIGSAPLLRVLQLRFFKRFSFVAAKWILSLQTNKHTHTHTHTHTNKKKSISCLVLYLQKGS